ncbi:rhoptry protein ROP14 [Besnoitia besnoiti]|uniref:Rhoptry protein ROP14 n=1 Tax=Besnoitia besnoiti TaxID=94643 RepID=A0A2A9MDH8_BESBE|nr:rhoptry protein ROP14 [Besnoitia besnoiti]PFH35929.1 rhoptry protein ROP14 [Besnoitia besnoiti]
MYATQDLGHSTLKRGGTVQDDGDPAGPSGPAGPLKSYSSTKEGWRGRGRDLIRRFWSVVNPTWSCTETRHRLDASTSAKLKSTYWLTRIVFLRSLGFVYFFAFLVAFNQAQGLIGSDGILPATDYVQTVKDSFGDSEAWERVKAFPSLFLLLPATDFWIHAVPLLGMVISLCMVIQGASSGFLLFFLWILYQTVNSVGQVWFSFGWESQLLELGFLAIWLCPFWSFSRLPPSWPTPKVCIWGNRWLLFRLMLGAGLIKLRGDAAWRDLTALDYHYETQPLPNPFSWYFQNQPHSLHAAQVVVTHIVECVLSFLVIIPFRQCRLFGGVVQILFQLGILVSGNLAFLNYMTVVSAVMCLDDHFLACLFPYKNLSRLPELVQGCGGSWSCPLVQAWPFRRPPRASFSEEKNGDEPREAAEAEAPLLRDEDTGLEGKLPLTAKEEENVDAPRSCCCWYRPHFLRWVRALRVPRRARKEMEDEIKSNWGKMLCELIASSAMLACMAFVTNPATSAVWMVIAVFFFAIILSSSSTFFTKTLVSNVFVELVLLVVTLWSFISLYQHGPAVWSVWLTACLFTVLIAFAYTTLTNAALIFKVHVEVLLFLLIAVLSVPVVHNLLSPHQVMDSDLGNPFSLVNTHGAFGSIAKERYELIIQGTNSASPDHDAEWLNYEFRCKPGNLYRRPCMAAPYHYRLDWLMWFAATGDLGTADGNSAWFSRFLVKLLENSKSVTGLLAHNPFDGSDPPTALRVLRMQYRFTKRPAFGNGPWWEVVPQTEEVFVSPSQVPGAAAHLSEQLEILRRREESRRREARMRQEAERRRREEEAFERRMRWAREEEQRRRREAEEAEKQRLEEQKRQAAEEKRAREAEEARRKAEEEAQRRAAEEELKRRGEAESRKLEEQRAAEVAQKEANENALKAAEEEEKRRREEELAEAKRQMEAREAEERRRKREEEQRQQAARVAVEKEAEAERKRQEEARAREAERAERERLKMLPQAHRERRGEVHVAAETPASGGGVPLRLGPLLLSRVKKRNLLA